MNPRTLVRLLVLLALTGATALALRAQLYLNTGHIDLNTAYADVPAGDVPAGFALYAHHTSTLAGGATVDEPTSHTVFFVPDSGGKYPTAGGILSFLGQSGQPVWLIPQNNPPVTVPWVGFGGYGLTGADGSPAADLSIFDPIPELTGSPTVPAVRVRFLSAITPEGADFALWQTVGGGAINLYFSNRPDTSAPQLFGLRRGQHIHFNWGFSRPGYYRIHLQIEGFINGAPVTPGQVSVDFAISELPLYEQWRRADNRFTELERATRSIGGPLADPDGDGRPNLLEYTLAADPRVPDAAPFSPVPVLDTVAATPTPALAFQRLSDPLLVYRVESSADLSNWSEIWRSTRAQNIAGPVAVPAPSSLSGEHPRRFLRLRASLVE